MNPPNGLRNRQGGWAGLADIMARNFINRAANRGAIAPSDAPHQDGGAIIFHRRNKSAVS